ncbi:hypothetical protein [Halohasta salina]|uniref:hypothetical protein n=1 Tax=Halohasta salina TaxID=2961621 RepID=UPI0020A5F82C|nr:hypothetical protein [Halohasta salina]
MTLTGKQIQWTAIVLGATCYFFLGALTEIALPVQFGVFLGIAVLVPAVVTRSVPLQQPVDEGDDEYRF